MGKVQDEALKAYPHDWPERQGFIKGSESVLKELHAWACGEYNAAELAGEDEKMLAFQDVKRKIMSLW